MRQSALDKFCTLCQETMQPNFLASCQGQADYFPEKYVKKEIKRNQSYKQMLPILSCTLRRFGHRTEEISSCAVWDCGAAKGSLAHQFKGLLQFVLSQGDESWQVPCRASGGCRGNPRGEPTSRPGICHCGQLHTRPLSPCQLPPRSPSSPILILRHREGTGFVPALLPHWAV